MRLRLRIIALVIVITAILSNALLADDYISTKIEFTFPPPNNEYIAVCTIVDGGPINIVIKKNGITVHKLIYKTLTEPLSIKPLSLKGRNDRDIRAILVECSGGSASHLYLLEINPGIPRVRKLIYGLNKGGVDYGFDSKHRLTGMRFHYQRWHVYGNFPGHIFTAIDYKWIPSLQEFREGNVHVDVEREKQADLIDILSAIGADYYLGVTEVTDDKNNKTTYYYKPVGILKYKTPAELRNAAKVMVTVQYEKIEPTSSYGYKAHIIDIRAVDSVQKKAGSSSSS